MHNVPTPIGRTKEAPHVSRCVVILKSVCAGGRDGPVKRGVAQMTSTRRQFRDCSKVPLLLAPLSDFNLLPEFNPRNRHDVRGNAKKSERSRSTMQLGSTRTSTSRVKTAHFQPTDCVQGAGPPGRIVECRRQTEAYWYGRPVLIAAERRKQSIYGSMVCTSPSVKLHCIS